MCCHLHATNPELKQMVKNVQNPAVSTFQLCHEACASSESVQTDRSTALQLCTPSDPSSNETLWRRDRMHANEAPRELHTLFRTTNRKEQPMQGRGRNIDTTGPRGSSHTEYHSSTCTKSHCRSVASVFLELPVPEKSPPCFPQKCPGWGTSRDCQARRPYATETMRASLNPSSRRATSPSQPSSWPHPLCHRLWRAGPVP